MSYSQMEIARFIAARKSITLEAARKSIQRHPEVIPVVCEAMAKLGIKPVKPTQSSRPPQPLIEGTVRLWRGRLWVSAYLMGEQDMFGPEFVSQYNHVPPVSPVWVPATAHFSDGGGLIRVEVDKPWRSSVLDMALDVVDRNHTLLWPKGALYQDDWFPPLADLYGDSPPSLSPYRAGMGEVWDSGHVDAVRQKVEAGEWRYGGGSWKAGEDAGGDTPPTLHD